MPTHARPDAIFLAWIRGWAITREVAPPVPHADGFRIDVGLPRQAARYVFQAPSPTLRELGTAVAQPWVYLKACATSDQLRALLPSNWRLEEVHHMMVCDTRPFPGNARLPAGYSLRLDEREVLDGRGHVDVLASDGAVAASGHIALDHELAIYDRIVTDPAHQRRGLGRVVMHALQALARAHGRDAGVLVATDPGRRLYESLGWKMHAPWATAVIPGRDDAA